jgi:hypothetical protein
MTGRRSTVSAAAAVDGIGGHGARRSPVPEGGPQRRPVLGGLGLTESRLVDRGQLDDEPRGLAICGIQDIGLLDPRRAGQIEDDAGPAGHHQAIAERLDQAASGMPDPRGKLERGLGNVDDHPVGVRQGEGMEIDPAVEVENEPGLLVVAGEAHVLSDRKRRFRRHRRRFDGSGGRRIRDPGGDCGQAAQYRSAGGRRCQPGQKLLVCAANHHRIRTSVRPC